MKESKIAHLVCGSTGAGKTTYSIELAKSLGGICFSIDEWMVNMFGEEAQGNMNPGWLKPRVARCEKQIWSLAKQLAAQDVPFVLDLGFQRREHREQFVSLAKEAGTSIEMHVLDVDPLERWRRVMERNENRGETFQFPVTRGMFDYVEGTWEPPTEHELNLLAC